MKILQTVTVKQVLTKLSKEKLQKKYQNKKQLLRKECDQLLFEMKKLERTRKYSSQGLRLQFDKEIESRKEQIKLIDFQMDQLEKLPLGSELKDQDVQELVEIKIGDNWNEISKGKTIVVTDGIITDIRKG